MSKNGSVVFPFCGKLRLNSQNFFGSVIISLDSFLFSDITIVSSVYLLIRMTADNFKAQVVENLKCICLLYGSFFNFIILLKLTY